MRRLVAAGILAAIAVGVYLWIRPSRLPVPSTEPPSPQSTVANPEAKPSPAPTQKENSSDSKATAASQPPEKTVAAPPPVPALSAAAAQQVAAPVADGLPPATVLANMRSTIRQYGEMFGGNPVGTNPEITRALNGDNPRHIRFLTEDGNRVNENGELVDSWGTPYFFHQLSAKEMEIRSAGPDKVMWTSDDLLTR